MMIICTHVRKKFLGYYLTFCLHTCCPVARVQLDNDTVLLQVVLLLLKHLSINHYKSFIKNDEYFVQIYPSKLNEDCQRKNQRRVKHVMENYNAF